MSEQQWRSQSSRQRHGRESGQEQAPLQRASSQSNRDDSAFDALLDEIDQVLETNAEEYVRSFVQKGGQ